MKAILAGFGLVAMLAGCVPPPQYGMAPSPPAQQAQTSDTGLPEQPEFKPMPPTDVRRMKCSTLNSASDDDKAYASTFLLGYRSGMVHSHVLDTKQIDTVVQAAVAECAAKPEESAYKVFATAQTKAAMAEHPAHHVLHRRLPTTPAAAPATTASPSQSPPLQYVPSPATPMETPSGEKASSATPVTPQAPAPQAPKPPGATDATAKQTPPDQPSPSATPAQPTDQPEASRATETPSGDASKP
ncbi:MAG TPA: HdeA/HdeB family chaperone [Stellaceae bacterium]|jgi:hypothetical protein|nr:HdeA/HdeB family chaperone [Stellaceae bacterium]